MNDILDEAHRVYERTVKDSIDRATEEGILKDDHTEGYNVLSRESFINRIKTDSVFSEKWGLKIEERELSLIERTKILVSRSDHKKDFYDRNGRLIVEEHTLVLDESNIPTKLITITYKDEKIEVYES